MAGSGSGKRLIGYKFFNEKKRIPIDGRDCRHAVIVIAALVSCATIEAAEPEALAISASIQARHFPFGTILDPIFAAPASDRIVGYTRCGDSAIWTGHYLAAEAFRYQVSGAPEARNNVAAAIAGIRSLVDVTGTDLLARCAIAADSPFAAGIESEEAHNGIYTNSATGKVWIGHTSRDQYAGALFGLAVAYDMVNDTAIRNSISDLITRLLDFLERHSWNVTMPDGSISTTFIGRGDQILSFLQIGQHVNPGRFLDLFTKNATSLNAGVTLPILLETFSDNSYFKFNLDYIDLYNLIRLDTSGSASYREAYTLLRKHTAGHENAFFDVIDRGLNGPDTARDAEITALLDAWLARPRRDVYVDLQGIVPVCGSQSCNPVPVARRPPTDFLWQRNPFQLAGGGQGLIESAGIDYILPYWMARYYGVSSPFVVESAAAGSSVVSPESIGAIYGKNLPAANLTVTDSAGVQREAGVLYASTSQVNFVLPAGSAAGGAIFQIGGISATGRVANVAPALFSASGNGTGVAAALAIRGQTPVPVFACEQNGCAATPIDLSLPGAVYLSLYGTGIRNRTSLSAVRVEVNGVSLPVLYGGPQPEFTGLDQVNVQLLPVLAGAGASNVMLTVDGVAANVVTIRVR